MIKTYGKANTMAAVILVPKVTRASATWRKRLLKLSNKIRTTRVSKTKSAAEYLAVREKSVKFQTRQKSGNFDTAQGNIKSLEKIKIFFVLGASYEVTIK